MERISALKAIAAELAESEPRLPAGVGTMLRIRDALDDPDCSADRAAKIVASDPLLAARIVATANSVAFNPSGREIAELKTALSRIGFSTARSLVMSRVAHELAGSEGTELQKQATEQLWSHCAHVAALSRLIARKVTKQNPEAAFFAGLVHELGSFYIISRANEYPALLRDDGLEKPESQDTLPAFEVEDTITELEQTLASAVIRALSLPGETARAIEACHAGFLTLPPVSMADTLLLAKYLAPVQSPLQEFGYSLTQESVGHAEIDMMVKDDTLANILADSAAEVASLVSALDM